MKITMIGDRGCGKTTFMAGLYRSMTNPEFRLKIRLSNKEQRARVDQIAQNLTNGIYPSGTAFEQEYKFDFVIDQVKILDFSWYDYRGGALMDYDNPQESDQLFNDIISSDGLLVFLDETTLDDHRKWAKSSKYWRKIQQMVRLHATHASEDHPRSLGIIHTKMDAEVQFKSRYPIEENVIDLVGSLPNADYLCGIVALSAINKDSSLNTLNVFFRVMTPFIIGALQEQAYKIEHTNQMNELLNNIAQNYDNAGWLDNFFTFLFGGKSSYDQVIDCVNLLRRYPLYKSKRRQELISSFMYYWKNRSVIEDIGTAFLGGRSKSSIAQQEFNEIIDIWVKFRNDIDALYGDWSDFILEQLKTNNGIDKGGYVLF